MFFFGPIATCWDQVLEHSDWVKELSSLSFSFSFSLTYCTHFLSLQEYPMKKAYYKSDEKTKAESLKAKRKLMITERKILFIFITITIIISLLSFISYLLPYK